MNKMLKFFNITDKTKLSFMSWIGSAFIVTYLLMSTYSVVQIHYLFLKGMIKEDVFERMISGQQQKLIEIVMIIVLFFFKGNSSTSTTNTSTDSTLADNRNLPIRKEE